MNESFQVLINYHDMDKNYAHQITQYLTEKGIRVWFDVEQLIPGRPKQESLESIVKIAQTVAILIGNEGLESWQNVMMRACLIEHVDRGLPVIPVLLPNAPEQPDLPLFLREYTWVDLRAGLSNEGLDNLRWGITGKKPNESNFTHASSLRTGSLRISKALDHGISEFKITSDQDRELRLPYKLEDPETKSQLKNLRETLRKLSKIKIQEDEKIDFNQLNDALCKLNDVGRRLLSQLFNEKHSEVVEFFRACCPTWKLGEDTLPIIIMAGLPKHLLPIEFLPLFDDTPWSPVDNDNELRRALRRFPGFSSLVQRELYGANVSRDPLNNDPVLPLKFFHHQELNVAKADWNFFSNHIQYLDLEGPWPYEPLDARFFGGNLAKHLQNPSLSFNGKMQSRPDQIQHFACHCYICEKTDSNESKLCFSSTLQASIGELKDHFVYNQKEDIVKSSKPIIFLNACGCVDDDSFAFNSFPEFFLIENKNSGFIGTEEEVPDPFASEFSEIFYQSLLRGYPLGESMNIAKWELVNRHRHPLGILYTMYANPDIHLLKRKRL